VILIAFGISRRNQRILSPGTGRKDEFLAVAIKVALMPLVAHVVARYALGLSAREVLTVVVLAALPTAQNVFTYDDRNEADVVPRDAVLVRTLASFPVLLLLSVVLH
jgi:predicted permease